MIDVSRHRSRITRPATREQRFATRTLRGYQQLSTDRRGRVREAERRTRGYDKQQEIRQLMIDE